MNINVTPLTDDQFKEPQTENFEFGKKFTDRMFSQCYEEGKGWHDAEIGAYRPFSFNPALSTLHYGQSFFEGLKAYRRPDGDINLFRPWENMKRFNRSAERMAMAQVDEEEHLDALVKLIEMEHKWVPDAEGASLYIRPFMFASEEYLGVHASKSYMHMIILGQVGGYFKEGFAPVSVYISHDYVRAVIGGTGDVKSAGNYAASLYVGEKAKKLGYSQVLWLDGVERRYVEEVGAMNFAVVYNGKHIVTPALSGSILPGVTRDSVLKLAPDLGYEVSETKIDVNDMLRDIASGEITEAFGCGTAAVIAPVGKLGDKNGEYVVGNGDAGAVSQHLFQALTDIQYGRVPDEKGWTLRIKAGGE
jgi:branched-chain amino acid aminotransferase